MVRRHRSEVVRFDTRASGLPPIRRAVRLSGVEANRAGALPPRTVCSRLRALVDEATEFRSRWSTSTHRPSGEGAPPSGRVRPGSWRRRVRGAASRQRSAAPLLRPVLNAVPLGGLQSLGRRLGGMCSRCCRACNTHARRSGSETPLSKRVLPERRDIDDRHAVGLQFPRQFAALLFRDRRRHLGAGPLTADVRPRTVHGCTQSPGPPAHRDGLQSPPGAAIDHRYGAPSSSRLRPVRRAPARAAPVNRRKSQTPSAIDKPLLSLAVLPNGTGIQFMESSSHTGVWRCAAYSKTT